MPNPTAGTDAFDFFDAPGGDLTLDDIFTPGDENAPNTTQTTAPTSGNPEEPFLKTATGSVYKSADDAIKGIEHKDALILELRQKLSDTTGNDPLRKGVPEAPAYVSYIENPKLYFQDLDAAAKSGDEAKILAVQQKFIQENLSPYAGILSNAVKSQAIEQMSATVPEFNKFLISEEYKETLDNYPLLKRSIEISESNPQASSDLGQLYRMAYEVSNGRNLPKIVEANRTNSAPTARPTVSSAPPSPTNSMKVVAPTLTTSDGRKAIIQQQEASGVDNFRF